MHRETLEIRLATEELWAELSGTAPAAALTRSLGRIRSRLAEHYRTANLELHQKKEELEQLRGQLSQQYEKLVRQKRNFDAWVAECREEVEQQAARLVARGEDLDRREADMGEYARQSQAEKLELQQEIRRLRSKLIGKAEIELPA
jgi:chromosome segregation ATPase